jgi:hypothetical protein
LRKIKPLNLMQHFNRWWLSIWCVHRKNFFSVFYVTRDKKKRKEKIVSKKRMFIWSFCSMFVEHDSLKLSHVRQSFDFEIGVRWKERRICFVLFPILLKFSIKKCLLCCFSERIHIIGKRCFFIFHCLNKLICSTSMKVLFWCCLN